MIIDTFYNTINLAKDMILRNIPLESTVTFIGKKKTQCVKFDFNDRSKDASSVAQILKDESIIGYIYNGHFGKDKDHAVLTIAVSRKGFKESNIFIFKETGAGYDIGGNIRPDEDENIRFYGSFFL